MQDTNTDAQCLPRVRQRLVVGLLLATTFWVVGCDGDEEEGADDDDVDSSISLDLRTGTRIEYVMRTSWEGASTEGGIPVVADADGTEIGIESLRLALGTLELIECPTLRHHTVESDSSAVFGVLDEELVGHEPSTFGTGFASGVSYCELRMLSVTSTGLLDVDPSVDEYASLVLEGWTRPAGSTSATPLVATVALADGSIRSIDAHAPWPDDVTLSVETDVAIEVTRRPALAFERLHVLDLDTDELAFELVGEVLRSSYVTAAER